MPLADVIEVRTRVYNGKMQYRRWNVTRHRWEDPYWIDMNWQMQNKSKERRRNKGFLRRPSWIQYNSISCASARLARINVQAHAVSFALLSEVFLWNLLCPLHNAGSFKTIGIQAAPSAWILSSATIFFPSALQPGIHYGGWNGRTRLFNQLKDLAGILPPRIHLGSGISFIGPKR